MTPTPTITPTITTAIPSPDHGGFDSTAFLASVTTHPGIYIFTDAAGETLYVGKARNLKRRLQSYFRRTGLAPKTAAMVARIAHAEVQQTRSDSEALLLENHLIKDRQPRYNILLRDDKSYPFIRLTSGDQFPRFTLYRGSRAPSGKYYGPFPNAGAVREMLGTIHKIFRLRQCPDAFFRNRTRPCLQYQIQRCSAPCVGKISASDYHEDLRQAEAMLAGHDNRLLDQLATKMEAAAAALDYEAAAVFRDRIKALQRIRERQYISSTPIDADIITIAVDSDLACFGVTSIRQGRHLGARFDIQPNRLGLTAAALVEAFIPQYYLDSTIPPEILLSESVANRRALIAVLSAQSRGKVALRHRCRAPRARWLESANIVTADHLRLHLSDRSQFSHQLAALTACLGLDEIPQRIECFDISHTAGDLTVASCVVFDLEGAVKSDYRRFNISGIEPGDDYAAMAQVLTRRYTRVLENQGKLPDLIIIDGGKGQLSTAQTVLAELQLGDSVTLVAVAKGAQRIAGAERLHIAGQTKVLQPRATSPESHLIQHIRDEAHRFAITGHRGRRRKAHSASALEQIEGVGDKRRRNLLRYFGGIQEIRRASVEDIAKAPGISASLARRIYNQLRG